MDYIKAKSEFNLAAAEILIDEHQNYAPSVHCAYYGCFQFIKSKLNSIGITYEQIDEDIAKSQQEGMKTLYSNKYPLDLIIREIRKKSDVLFVKKVRDSIKDLKTFRVESDYHNVQIDYSKSYEALNLSREIIKLIKEKL